MFLQGVLGYGSIVHLKNESHLRCINTSHKAKQKNPLTLSQFKVLGLFHSSSKTGNATYGCQKGKFAHKTNFHEDWQ